MSSYSSQYRVLKNETNPSLPSPYFLVLPTQFCLFGLCSMWQMWNKLWHCHGGRLFQHWSGFKSLPPFSPSFSLSYTQFRLLGLCSMWQMWNKAWHCHGGSLFQHWSGFFDCVSPPCYIIIISNIYYIFDIWLYSIPGSRCLMGSKQRSLWICTGLFGIDKRFLGSTSSRVEVLLFIVLPSPSQYLYGWRVSMSFVSSSRDKSFPRFQLLRFHSLIDLNVVCSYLFFRPTR